MKRQIFPILAMGLAMAACTNEYGSELIQQENDALEVAYTGVQKEIMINVLTSKFGGYDITTPKTRALNEFTMTPFVQDGDTLMYVVQYADGFEIYSAKMCTEMVLFSSETGKFDMKDPNMPEALRILITSTAEEVRQMAIAYPDYINPSWGAPSLTQEEIEKGEIKIDWEKIAKFNATPYSVNGNEDSTGPGDNKGEKGEGGWVLIKTEEVSDNTSDSKKLIETKWYQSTPWNYYAKERIDKNGNKVLCPAGCTPVAVGQYMYFTHYKNGVPKTTVSGAYWDNKKGDYIFTGESETIWDTMARNVYEESTDSVALFLGYLGREMKTDYQIDGSGTYDSDQLNFLNKIYDNKFYKTSFDFDEVKRILMKGYPILCSALSLDPKNPKKEIGHSFLIDQYRRRSVKTRYYYGWEGPYGEMGEDTNAYDEEGNVTDWGITFEADRTVETYWISMNWGGESYYFDILFYSPGSGWGVDNFVFDRSKTIFMRKDL